MSLDDVKRVTKSFSNAHLPRRQVQVFAKNADSVAGLAQVLRKRGRRVEARLVNVHTLHGHALRVGVPSVAGPQRKVVEVPARQHL
jgi:hypothetical protein